MGESSCNFYDCIHGLHCYDADEKLFWLCQKMECSFKKFFETHCYAVENLLDLSNGIIKKLLDSKILTPRQYAEVEVRTLYQSIVINFTMFCIWIV